MPGNGVDARAKLVLAPGEVPVEDEVALGVAFVGEVERKFAKSC